MKSILFLAAVLFTSPALAHHWDHRDHDLGRDVHDYKFKGHIASKVVQCGDTITASMSLANDLICPTTTGFALQIIGDGITLDGNGHKIEAPLAAGGLFVEGSKNTVRNLKVNGIAGGSGILAYEAPGVKIQKNELTQNLQGVVLYADRSAVTEAEISNNKIRGSLLFGIRTGFDAPGAIVNPKIRGNDLSNSGNYAMLIEATSFELGGEHGNTMLNSQNGIYLALGNFNIHDFSIKKDKILKAGIFIDSATNLVVKNVDVSSIVPASPSQERVGMDLYRVAHYSIQGLRGDNCDVGLKFENERGTHPEGSVTGSHFFDNSVSGVLIISYDGSTYGVMKFLQNCFRDAIRVYLVPGTFVAAGSILDDGVNACGDSRDRDDDDRDHDRDDDDGHSCRS